MTNVPSGFDVRGRALLAGELAPWLAEHSLGNRFGLAVLSGPARGGAAIALAVVAADGDGRHIDVAALTPDDEAALASWLADPGPPKAVHDAKSTMHALAGCGWTLRGITSDTLLAGHLLQPEQRRSALNDLLVRHMRCALPPEAVGLQQLSLAADDQSAIQALILRTCAVLDLAEVLDEELARIDASSLLGRVELPVARVLTQLETTGIAVDRGLLAGTELLKSIAPEGRIHATLHQTGTVTGRLSSSNPNLHDDAIGAQLRAALVAADGHQLMTASYRQLEPQLSAHLSGGAGERGLVADARRVGYASTLLGRRRYLSDLDSGNSRLRRLAEQDAIAMAVEGSAADVVKLAMIGVDQTLAAAGLKSRMVLQTGDDLVFEVADGERDTLVGYVSEQMLRAYELPDPLDVHIR